eukprot:3376514-Rhodomonas_salina.2
MNELADQHAGAAESAQDSNIDTLFEQQVGPNQFTYSWTPLQLWLGHEPNPITTSDMKVVLCRWDESSQQLVADAALLNAGATSSTSQSWSAHGHGLKNSTGCSSSAKSFQCNPTSTALAST